MSGFLYNGVDIYNNYQPLGDSGMKSDSSTNFMTNGQDLNTIFMAYQNGTMYDVPYSINDISLGSIFQHEVYSNDILYNISGGVETDGEISGVYYNDIITFTSSGVFEVTHNNNNRPINFLLVGPGGDGSSSSFSSNFVQGERVLVGGDGGGGGEVIDSSFLPVSGTYNISMGSSAVTEIKDLSDVQISQARPGYDGVSDLGLDYNGKSGSGNSQGEPISVTRGRGGGGDSAAGSASAGGWGTAFNYYIYGHGGDGGSKHWNDAADTPPNLGYGGRGGGYKNANANTNADSYSGAEGGSGICILYFNPIEI